MFRETVFEQEKSMQSHAEKERESHRDAHNDVEVLQGPVADMSVGVGEQSNEGEGDTGRQEKEGAYGRAGG